jgi:nitronate monooxygenase
MSNKQIRRRDFLRKSFYAGTALALSGKSLATKQLTQGHTERNRHGTLPLVSRQFMKMFDLKYPIIQAPAAGPATSVLASAVAAKGGFGGLPLTWSSPDEAFNDVKAVQRATQGSFFANYVLSFEPKSLDMTINAGVKVVQFSWGIPDKKITKKLRDAGVLMGIQVTSEASAKAALDAGADYLVCQGSEAGGHVHASRPLAEALERVLTVAGDVPVAASGGIANGTDMAKYLDMGAAAVVMGSRFVATRESNAHMKYKEALVKAKSEDTVFTVCLNTGWENATHRILRNQTFENWEAAGCPRNGSRPGEGDLIAIHPQGSKIHRYSGTPPTRGMTGDVTDTGMYAGMGVDSIYDIPSVSEVIDRVWNEYLKA